MTMKRIHVLHVGHGFQVRNRVYPHLKLELFLDHAKQTCSYVFVRVGAVFPTGPSLQTSIKDP